MISEKIKKYRMENGLTQQEMAKALHSSQNAISNYETGIRTPTVKKLIAIATLLGCSVSDLTEDCSGTDRGKAGNSTILEKEEHPRVQKVSKLDTERR